MRNRSIKYGLYRMTHREGSIQEPFLVVVPSNAPGGLDAMSSGNLANCDAYTVALVYDCNVLDVVVEPNQWHGRNPVDLLRYFSDLKIKVLITDDIKTLPRTMCTHGLSIRSASESATVRQALKVLCDRTQ